MQKGLNQTLAWVLAFFMAAAVFAVVVAILLKSKSRDHLAAAHDNSAAADHDKDHGSEEVLRPGDNHGAEHGATASPNATHDAAGSHDAKGTHEKSADKHHDKPQKNDHKGKSPH